MKVRLTVEAEEELSGAAVFHAREATVTLANAFIDESVELASFLKNSP